ncbi:hypothetical protein BD408DRAFT_396917 [Parasitella parasitica]|nr:hypothetical protein BD408DRAFT_396917 [Parasitella parasitica]
MTNMQWRSLMLLLSGLAVVYIAILSQDTPYLHPKIIYTSNNPSIFSFTPDKLVLTTVGAYIYLTAFKFEAVGPESKGFIVGTGRLKLGIYGLIKQVKRPISHFLTERDFLETDEWIPCFEHTLKGPVSKVSIRNSHNEGSQTQFAVLYHEIEDDSSYHYVRVYYTTVDENQVTFEYKDIQFPGTTWVEEISLENSSLLYSRDPDQYEFHIMNLPSTFTQLPHATLSSNYSIEHGRRVEEWSQPYSTEQSSILLSRLYSPINNTYRVFTLSVHKTSSTFYVNITIADNATTINAENKPVKTWIQREKGKSEYPVYNEENIDYVGFADVTNYQSAKQQVRKLDMPELHSSVSTGSSTIVFPYIKNKFITLDFTDRIDILMRIKKEKERLYSNNGRKSFLNEYYYWQGYETVDAEIKGLQLSDKDDMLALWTEFSYVYIYGRKKREHKAESTLGKIDRWIDYWLSEISEEERELQETYFPAPWLLEMAISPIKDVYGVAKDIGTVQFWRGRDGDDRDPQYIFIALKNGNVNSYRLDKYEHQKKANLWSFASERWDMLFAMLMVIAIFVYNEYQRP